MGVAGRRRRRVEPTDEWEQLQLLCRWPEQLVYKEIRPLVLFRMPVAERAGETGSSERTLYRRISRFEAEGMGSLFAPGNAKRRALPPSMRRFIVDLKAEHPRMRPHEISTVCYVKFGRRPDYRTVERVLAEEPMPLRMVRRFPPYHETAEPKERRTAVVTRRGAAQPLRRGVLCHNRKTQGDRSSGAFRDGDRVAPAAALRA